MPDSTTAARVRRSDSFLQPVSRSSGQLHVWLWTTAASLAFALSGVALDVLGSAGHFLILAHIAAVAIPALRLGRRGAWGGGLMSALAFAATDAVYSKMLGRSHETPGDLAIVVLTSLALAVLCGEFGQALHRQRQLTERARRSEQRFNNLLNSLPSGLLAVDSEGRIVLANRTAVDLLGCPLDDTLGSSLLRFVPEGDQPRMNEALAERQPGPPIRIPVVRPDGHRSRMGWLFSPYVEEGRPGVLLYFWDDEMTIQREQEATTLAAAVSSLREGVVLADQEGRIRFANRAAAAIYGCRSPGTMVGRALRDFAGASMVDGFEDRIARAQSTGSSYEALVRRESGAEVPVHVTTSPVRIDGALFGTIDVVTDLTEQKQIANRAALADKLATLGRLVAGAAHEINNPLGAVLAHAELLQLDGAVPQSQITSLDVIIQETRRAGRIVRDLLSYARQNPIVKADVPLDRIVSDVLTMRAGYHRSNGIEVQVWNDARDVIVHADADQVKQVLLNLIVNAEDVIKERLDRRLEVRMTRVGTAALVLIDDSGPGVPETLRQRVFEPFFTTKPEGKGTGLGLSVSYGIVREHGGRIWVEASPKGGARFVVQLPLGKPAVEGEAMQLTPPVPAVTTPARTLRVLIVDDEPGIRRAAARILSRHGHSVTTAEGGSRALELARQETFDVIICDLRMPDLTGPECHAALKREGRLRDVVFVVATGDVADAQSHEFVHSEHLTVLLKPFDMASLLAVLTKCEPAVA